MRRPQVKDQQSSLRKSYFYLLLLGFFGVFTFLNSSEIFVKCFEVGDYATNALRVETALEGKQLLGPYSRYRFQHPGPILFYIRALAEICLPFLPSKFAVHTFSQYCLNILFFVLALIFILRKSSELRTPILVLLCSLLWLTNSGYQIWLNSWGPTAVVLPFFLFLVSSAKYHSGDQSALLWMVLSGSFAVQTHVGTGLPIAATGGFCLLAQFFNTQKAVSKSVLILAVALGVFLWLPVLYQSFFSAEGSNLLRIVHYAASKSSAHSFKDILDFLGQYYFFFLPQTQGGLLSMISAIGMLFLPFRKKPFLYSLRSIVFIAFCFSLILTFRTHGELYAYLGLYNISIASLMISLYCSAAFSKLQIPQGFRYALSASIFAGIILCCSLYGRSPKTERCNARPGELYSQLSPEKGNLYVIEVAGGRHQGAWEEAAGLALALERADVNYCVPGKWAFLFGKARSCRQKDLSKAKKKVILRFSLKSEWRKASAKIKGGPFLENSVALVSLREDETLP